MFNELSMLLAELEPLCEEYFPTCFLKFPRKLAAKVFPDTDFTKDHLIYTTPRSKKKIGIALEDINNIIFVGSDGGASKNLFYKELPCLM